MFHGILGAMPRYYVRINPVIALGFALLDRTVKTFTDAGGPKPKHRADHRDLVAGILGMIGFGVVVTVLIALCGIFGTGQVVVFLLCASVLLALPVSIYRSVKQSRRSRYYPEPDDPRKHDATV